MTVLGNNGYKEKQTMNKIDEKLLEDAHEGAVIAEYVRQIELVQSEKKTWMRMADQRSIEVGTLKVEAKRLRELLHGCLNGDPEAENEARVLLYGGGDPAVTTTERGKDDQHRAYPQQHHASPASHCRAGG